ncbi:hypothetical protein D3C83_332070 [compost metagenome]
MMIPTNHMKQANCTKKNANRMDATMFVWTRHTCTIDWRIRAIRTVAASASINVLVTLLT